MSKKKRNKSNGGGGQKVGNDKNHNVEQAGAAYTNPSDANTASPSTLKQSKVPHWELLINIIVENCCKKKLRENNLLSEKEMVDSTTIDSLFARIESKINDLQCENSKLKKSKEEQENRIEEQKKQIKEFEEKNQQSLQNSNLSDIDIEGELIKKIVNALQGVGIDNCSDIEKLSSKIKDKIDQKDEEIKRLEEERESLQSQLKNHPASVLKDLIAEINGKGTFQFDNNLTQSNFVCVVSERINRPQCDDDLKKNNEELRDEKDNLERKANEAQADADKARKAQQKAEEQRDIAIKEKDEALEKCKIAQEAQQKAEEQRDIAIKKKDEAEKKAQDAEAKVKQNKEWAEKKIKEANDYANLCEKHQHEAEEALRIAIETAESEKKRADDAKQRIEKLEQLLRREQESNKKLQSTLDATLDSVLCLWKECCKKIENALQQIDNGKSADGATILYKQITQNSVASFSSFAGELSNVFASRPQNLDALADVVRPVLRRLLDNTNPTWIDILARAYAYSQVGSFARLLSANGIDIVSIGKAYGLIQYLMQAFGITLVLPTLFADSFNDTFHSVHPIRSITCYVEENEFSKYLQVNDISDDNIIVDINKIGYSYDGVVVAKPRICRNV